MEDFREEIKDKTKREQTLKEQKKSKSRLSFEDESKGMIPGSGMARKGATVVSETVSAYGQKKIREGTDDNAALDAANQMELAGESLARKSIYVRERLKEKRQRNNRLRESVLEETEKSRLQFGTSVSNEAKRAVQKEAEQKKQSALKKLLQKKRYQKQYQAAKQGKAVKDAVLVNAQRFTEKAKAAVKELVAQNRNILLSIGVLVLLFALMATSLSSCAALFQGSSNAIISTSYSSEDEDIYAAENAYVALENALNEQINQMKANHSDYDEFQFQIDEIGHNPYQLISYLTVKYGGFTYAEVADEIQEIFREQYGLYTDSTRETVTEKKTVRVGESLGQVVTSGYCNCPICCGQWSGGPTASGAYPQANHTIAVDASNPFVPMGTHVIMNGVEYVVEDTGNFAQYGVQFDVFYGGHASASAHGHQTWEAYIADSNGSQEVEVTTTREVNRLDVTLTNHNLDVVKGIDLQDNDHFAMTVGGKLYTDKKEAGVALLSAASGLKSVKSAGQIGEYHGFALSSEYNFLSNTYTMTIKGKCSYKIEFGKDTLGNIQRIHNALSAIGKKLADTEQNLETVQQQLKTAQEEVQKPFPKEAELSEKMERLAELNAMLNMDEKGGENLLADEGIGENPEVNMPEERQDRIADSVHKTSVLERLKEQKQQEQTRETQQKPKKKHEQEL